MNCQILWEGTDITSEVISYKRDENICDTSGNFDFEVHGSSTRDFQPSDTMVLYEGGVKTGTYMITTISRDFPGYRITVNSANSSQKLISHFIETKYLISDDPTLKSRYWIEKFMQDAGVAYSFDIQTGDSDGQYLPDDQILGGSIAMDEIRKLLSYSGWFMRTDPDGVLVVGDLEYESTSYATTVDDNTILSIKLDENDSFLRNRVVVWGMGNISCSGFIFADIHAHTPWNYDENDLRTVVISNQNIDNPETALSIASQGLKEFTKETYIKNVRVAGYVNARLGDRVSLSSRHISRICTITTISSSMSRDGEITELVLDERCPRLIGYFNPGGNVYIGTKGQGIWKKNIRYNHTWEDFSSGISVQDMEIKDLHIANGVYAATTYSGELYYIDYATGNTAWTKIPKPMLYHPIDGITYTGFCQAVSVNPVNSEIIAGYNTRELGISLYSGMVPEFFANGGFVSNIRNGSIIDSKFITLSGLDSSTIFDSASPSMYDLDNNGKDTYITVDPGIYISGIQEWKRIPGDVSMSGFVQYSIDRGGGSFVVSSGMYSLSVSMIPYTEMPVTTPWLKYIDWHVPTFGGEWQTINAMWDSHSVFFFDDTRIRLKEGAIFSCHIDQAPSDCFFKLMLIDDYGVHQQDIYIDAYDSTFVPSPEKPFNDPFDINYEFSSSLAGLTVARIIWVMDARGVQYTEGNVPFVTYYSGTFSNMQFGNVSMDGTPVYGWLPPAPYEISIETSYSRTPVNNQRLSESSCWFTGKSIINNYFTHQYQDPMYNETIRDIVSIPDDGLDPLYYPSESPYNASVTDLIYLELTFPPNLESGRLLLDLEWISGNSATCSHDGSIVDGTMVSIGMCDYLTEYTFGNKTYYGTAAIGPGLPDADYNEYFPSIGTTRRPTAGSGGYWTPGDYLVRFLGIRLTNSHRSSTDPEDLFVFRITGMYWQLESDGSIRDIGQPGVGNMLIRHNGSSFDRVGYVANSQMHVDCSKDLPVVVYGGTEEYNQSDFDWSPDGYNIRGFNELLYTTGDITYSGYTYSGYTGGFPIGMQYISDYRTFDALTPSGYGRYGMIAQRMMTNSGTSNIRGILYDANYSGIQMDNYWYQFSGFTHKLEATNRQDYPTLFVATYDSITASGIGGNMMLGNDIRFSGWHFWQKDGYYLGKGNNNTTFVERSVNLPQCEISVIRVDDII